MSVTSRSLCLGRPSHECDPVSCGTGVEGPLPEPNLYAITCSGVLSCFARTPASDPRQALYLLPSEHPPHHPFVRTSCHREHRWLLANRRATRAPNGRHPCTRNVGRATRSAMRALGAPEDAGAADRVGNSSHRPFAWQRVGPISTPVSTSAVSHSRVLLLDRDPPLTCPSSGTPAGRPHLQAALRVAQAGP
jgi:hypothetical protein